MRYVNFGYVVTLATLAGYSWRVVRRGRTLARALPRDERRAR